MGLYTTAMVAITEYTGLSPAAFFTILALMVVVYKVVCGMFVAAVDYSTVKKANSYAHRSPVQLGDLTEEELRAYDGSDPEKPLLMAVKGQVYDVSRSRMFYGPGGPYGLFAGRDASRALALMSFDPQDLTGNIEGLSASDLDVLQDWEYKFMEKYIKVGQLVSGRKQAEPAENGDKMQESMSKQENEVQKTPISE
ncbi:Membrane steroid-binding protein 2 [Sarracenia purpurea var. burkii]